MRFSLPDVTLIAISGFAADVEPAQAALIFSAEAIDFGAVKLLACNPPRRPAPGIEHHSIEGLDWVGYNRFVLHRLLEYVDTPYCLLVQSDGFVLNAENWDDAFLDYDYIGAPWPAAFNTIGRVGNGGFSLRSRRLLELTRMLAFGDSIVAPKAEDIWIGHHAHDWLTQQGVRFPDVSLAMRFAMELPVEEGPVDLTRTFGFHGNKDLAGYLLEVGPNQHLSDSLRTESLDRLVQWIRAEAGSSNTEYFLCERPGGLALQQVPEEYARLLEFFRTRGVRRYLELGIGRAGSFMTNTLMMSDSLETAHAVESCAYGQQPEELTLRLYLYLKRFQTSARFGIFLGSTQSFFAEGSGADEYDCIFVDADHSYEGVSYDFQQAVTRLAPGGCIVLHDINSKACPGVQRLWNEIRHAGCLEFVASDTCGIGIWQPQESMTALATR